MNNVKETIPSDAPKDIQNIIQQCWKDNTEERIVLENMLKIIESDGLELQTIDDINDDKLLEVENSPRIQNSEMFYKISQSMNFNPDEVDNILEENSQEQSSSLINISNNKNIHPTDLEDKKSTGINTNSTKVKRRISYHQNNSNYDLAGFQAQEEQQLQQTQTQIPPK